MFNVLHLIYMILTWLLWLYSLFIVIDAIMSWLPMLSNSVVGRFLDKIVDPYLNLFRRGPFAKLAYSTGIDISPIIGLFILYFVQNYVLVWIFNILLRLVG
ncbi:YggT family protein [Lactobacillus acidophilus]|uniref:YggT family protein n=1 Tax=Lactobacillus acidophilus TaxID=1579 RepID=UPI00019F5F94|nr:YggT family protein [Lactobacillus acidophilus]AZN76888.1 YggT family protein [Lactobacillus acidophilus]EEJ76005.1 YGGT family protein [Lactobacillus acidophilus ATCC 4796]MBN3462067.1 YggT family protein [Lactobacillus acidophilus]MBN3479364.1 YggT family protein [Lactobacillus acidophilus]MBN3481308.1 YggT family protein [Lactobacillus acidophilus]